MYPLLLENNSKDPLVIEKNGTSIDIFILTDFDYD